MTCVCVVTCVCGRFSIVKVVLEEFAFDISNSNVVELFLKVGFKTTSHSMGVNKNMQLNPTHSNPQNHIVFSLFVTNNPIRAKREDVPRPNMPLVSLHGSKYLTIHPA